jgi:hypothetical protein
MNSLTKLRMSTTRAQLRARRADRDARRTLEHELAAFDSPADLLELSAMLERHDDAETETIRRIVDWQRAA